MQTQPRPGLSMTAGVVEFLRHRRSLLVIDNCEHVLDATADFVAAVVADCPNVGLLITSREALGVRGERITAVSSLPVPAFRTRQPGRTVA